MKVFYDSDYADELTQKIYKNFMDDHEDRDKIHLSDTCHCPLKAWNRLVGLEPVPPNNAGVGIMMLGIVGQGIIQRVYPDEWAEWEPDPDMPSHIDIYVQEEEKSFPVEIKWSRKSIYRGTDITKPWLLQTTGYMAKVMENEGKFVVLNIMYGRLNAFKLVMSDEELIKRNKEIEDTKQLILTAIEENDPNMLEPWVEECKYCPYRDTRIRSKHDLEKGCPRYKGEKATQTDLDEFFS